MTDEEVPEGRVFGKGQLDSENTLAALRAEIDALQSIDGAALGRRMSSVEDEVIKALERINVLRGDIDAATFRIAKLERDTEFETSEDDARLRQIERRQGTWLDEVKSQHGRLVLDRAEVRIREYMTGSFSEATIGGVVRALRGEVNNPPRLGKSVPTNQFDLPRMPSVAFPKEIEIKTAQPDQPQYVTDHAAYPGCCDRPAVEHTALRAKTRPIRDQPQA